MTATPPTLSAAGFAAKWRDNARRERASSQEHFIDVCHLVGVPTPNEADPTARRVQSLDAESKRLDDLLESLVSATAPELVASYGVGTDTAGALLVSAGDNPERLRSEAAFAHLCGVAPIDASSGLTSRKRLNRGGDRSANHALWRIVMVRMVFDARTRAYVTRRTAEGRSKREIIRSLKRYVARELYRCLPRPQTA